MRLGIDFGTTRTVVAMADRGNYPVLSFQAEHGDALQWYPGLIAAKGEKLAFGFEAQARQQEKGWSFLRSLKRRLADASPQSLVPLGENSAPVQSLLQGYLASLKHAIHEHSNLGVSSKEPLEALIAVPANANSNQRFLTLEGFRRAGFRVLGMINEPSAAGIEYAQRYCPKIVYPRQEYLVVYDLGGGTFDTSIVSMRERAHDVLTNEGISQLGGDDFDELLLELALSRSGVKTVTPLQRFLLLEICREQKEGLHPNTRRIVIDLGAAIEGAAEVIVPVTDFYQRCQSLVQQTVAAVESAVSHVEGDDGADWKDISAVYLVGGSSDLPVVSRIIREHYGRRVRRSPYPFAATAIGLAIAADKGAGYELKERFTRHFGVWREEESGRKISFDSIFPKDFPLPAPGQPPLSLHRAYHPVHNIGHFRYLECSRLTADGQPAGDITPWDEIFFPFDPALQSKTGLSRLEVIRSDAFRQQLIEETYACNASGMIEVRIGELTTGFARKFRIRS